MSRRTFIPIPLALLAVFLFLFASCSGGSVTEEPSAPAETAETAAEEHPIPEETPMNTELALFPAVSAAESFNRMTFRYTSASPLELNVVYSVDGAWEEDRFYLEAGEEGTFSALIKPYLKGKTASDLRFDSIRPLDGKKLDARILSAELETVPVYAKDVLTLEGSRYKVGIKLSWGGGISEIHDRDNPVKGLGNLCNNCDTGRLIQQSYYGTGANGEYKPGEFNGSVWTYNPVQGGNKYNQTSRIIDVTVGEDFVTIKAQPADWSTKDFLTPSYMENTYTVSEDWIRIDNRFVDFSGWDNPPRSQEIPAFYTVSWLDSFVRYAGRDSWTGGALTWERNLPFWGDSGVHSQCVFPLEAGQTETWCAWVNEQADYGIGLYVPGADVLVAGRHAYNKSKNPADGATNYVAPLETFAIASFRPVEYSSLITTGSVAEIRAAFSKYRDFTENAFLLGNSGRVLTADYRTLDLTSPDALPVFGAPVNNASASFDEAVGAVCLTADVGFDPYIAIGYGYSSPVLSADDYRNLRIEYMIPEDNRDSRYSAEFFLCSGSTAGPTAGISIRVSGLAADGEWHTEDISLDKDFWSGEIRLIRFDFFDGCADGDRMYVRKIELLP